MFHKNFAQLLFFLLFIAMSLFSASHDGKLKNYDHILEQYRFAYASCHSFHRIEVIPKNSEESHPIGTLLLCADWDDGRLIYLDSIDIQESYKSLGIGSLLLQAALKVITDKGYKRIKLLAYPQLDNEEQLDEQFVRLVAWYKRFGFKEIASTDDIEGGAQAMQADAPFMLDLVPMPEVITKKPIVFF